MTTPPIEQARTTPEQAAELARNHGFNVSAADFCMGSTAQLAALIDDVLAEERKGRVTEVKRLVNLIHKAVKRGEDTEDHGVIGNLRCILDHVLPDPPDFMDSQPPTPERVELPAITDAERYQWLRDKSMCQYEHPIVVSQKKNEYGIRYIGPLTGKALDTEVDAAIAQARKS